MLSASCQSFQEWESSKSLSTGFVDDEHGIVSKAWAGFKGEIPVWYWITFIPQLLTSLSHRGARNARDILIRIARSFPQVSLLYAKLTFLGTLFPSSYL